MEIEVMVRCKVCGYAVRIQEDKIEDHRHKNCSACGASATGFQVAPKKQKVWYHKGENELKFLDFDI